MIVEIQCLPFPPGTPTNEYAHIEAAIRVIQDSGLGYEVGALGTTIEGEPDVLWPLMRRVHEAVLAAGATGTVTVLKVEQRRVGGPTINDLIGKFR